MVRTSCPARGWRGIDPILQALQGLLILGGIAALAQPALGEERAVFASIYTSTENCKAAPQDRAAERTGTDTPQKCSGPRGYYVYEYYSAFDTHRQMRHDDDREFVANLTPRIGCGAHSYGKTVEWRLRNGTPFAAIHRVICYGNNPRDDDYRVPENLLAEFLLVRGLRGQRLGADLDMRATPNANQAARAAADRAWK